MRWTGNTTRLLCYQIAAWVVTRYGPLTRHHLESEFGIAREAASRHLADMEFAGILMETKPGTYRVRRRA